MVVLLDVACNVEDRVVLGSRHTDDQVDGASCHLLLGLFPIVYLNEARREAQAQFSVFGKDFLIHAPIVLQHEGIVWIGNEQNIAHAIEHKVNKGSIFQRHLVSIIQN